MTTELSTLTLAKTLVIGLISQQKMDKIHVYIDILSKFLKACFNFYSEQNDIVFVPLDFLIAHSHKLGAEKVGKLVTKLVHLLKQVIYEVSMQQATHMAAYSVAANKSNALSEALSYENPGEAQELLIGKNVKTIVFSLGQKWTSEKDVEMKDIIIRGLSRAVSETFF